jgi:protein-S-isoprenylcysteine O-methyltransferase Ste14
MVTESRKAFRRTKLYDLIAAAPLIAWYLYCVAQILPTVAQQVALIRLFARTDLSVLPAGLVLSTLSHVAALVFFSVLIVMFTVRYVPRQTASGFYPRCAAMVGTFLGVSFLLLPLQELSSTLYLVSLMLIISGFVFAIWASLVLGRSISILPEARRLVTWGPYRFVRHPLYVGEIVAMAGVALQYLSAWALLLLGLQLALQLLRMKYEEQILLQAFSEYASYMARTARLVPGVY